ncbi:hypothetical protein FTUN_1982 [Frigoriglobus tundricola]|uniref:Uncharacterized protein n=1 Tax=Frigoriglobus tundricola TaxID=2774151 RepID=A0A6M5YNC2_9BACT|nr:hypothetical protein FTUN_1982 [Frigoriglobus tundricola]
MSRFVLAALFSATLLCNGCSSSTSTQPASGDDKTPPGPPGSGMKGKPGGKAATSGPKASE